jgi:uncharacterized protein YbjT (DUF2867 family)
VAGGDVNAPGSAVDATQNPAAPKILVLGSTGFVGRALVQRLVAEGEAVRAASRRPAAREDRPGSGVSTVACDLRDPATLEPALRGIECVYYLVHSMGSGGGDFRRVERECAQNLARAAAASGCRRIVYLGGVAPRGRPSEHLASRLEVGEILRAGEVLAVELRAAMIVGNGSVSWQIVRDLAVRLPLMILPQWLESKSCPVALQNVMDALVGARRVPLDRSAWFDLPGPDVMTAREMLRRVALLRGHRVPMVRVPVLTPRLSALWLKLVTGADYAIARELVLGLAEDLLPESDRYWDLIEHGPLVSFDDAARNALRTEEPRPAVARLEEGLVNRVGKIGGRPDLDRKAPSRP